MVILSSALALLLTFQVFAVEQAPRLICATNPLTTTYQVSESQDSFHLTVTHHNGTQFAPLFWGQVTIANFEELKLRHTVIEKLGQRYNITFAKQDCSKSDAQWVCAIRNPVQINQLSAQAFYFRTDRVREIHNQSTQWQLTNISVTLKVDGENLSFKTQYWDPDCQSFPPL